MKKRYPTNLPGAPRLTLEQVSDGMKACHENAKRLIDDAQSLLARGSHATAWFLAIIAQEELAKIQLISMQGLPFSDREKARAWWVFTHHEEKLAVREAAAVAIPAGKYSDAEHDAITKTAARHHQAKLDALYVGRLRDGRWPRPAESIKVGDAPKLVAYVQEQVRRQPISSPEQLAFLGRFMNEYGLTGILDPQVAMERLRELLPEEAAEIVIKQLIEMALPGAKP